MWKQVLQVATRFWKVAEETQRNSTEIRELRQELNDMGKILDRVLYELQRQNIPFEFATSNTFMGVTCSPTSKWSR